MAAPTFRQKLQYRFDNFMAQGGKSMFLLLSLFFVGSYLVLGLLRVLMASTKVPSERGDGSLLREIYITFLQMTDPGNMAQDIESSPFLKVATVLSGLAGVILLSSLIGFITTALVAKMEDLRKGRSKVIEDESTLILGWNEQRVVEILRELILANESEDDPSVVILADVPKEEMDDYLSLVLPDTGNTRVVTRSGSASASANLRMVSAGRCKSAIVLAAVTEEASDEEKALSDAQTIKTILALSTYRDDGKELNIVAELYDQRNHEIVQASCRHPITVLDANDILAKIIVQTSRSVGLSVAYGEILSFDGCEMYFHHAKWGGIAFGKLLYHFPDGVPMGIRNKDGEIFVNPPADRALAADDDILIVAEDDSTIEFRSKAVAQPRDLALKPGRQAQRIENELIIGWNRKASGIISEYADYVLDGSRIDVIVNNPNDEIHAEIERLNSELANLTVTLIEADPLQLETLLAAAPGKRDNIIILSGGNDDHDAEKADARTILILLLLRRVFSEQEEPVQTRLVTEVMDSANQNLIAHAGVKDFIISNRFISMLLAQISEEPDIKRVYDDLFSEDGSEIYLKPASLYFEEMPIEVSFADCMAIAQKRAEICIGIKITALETDPKKNFGVKLIPEKNTKYTLRPEDCLVVVAEDES